MTSTLNAVTHVWAGIDHAEGVAIDSDGTVWAGGEEGQIYRGSLDGEPEVVATVPGQALGVTLDGRGGVYVAVCTGTPGLYGVTGDGATSLVSAGTDELPCTTPNFAVVLPTGAVVWTDSGEWGADDARIYRTDDAGTRVADTSCRGFANGLALSSDGRTLAVAESTLPGVTLLTVGEDGSLGDRRVLAELPGTVPDGLAYDAGGRLLVACYAPDAILRVERDGAVETLVHDPLRTTLSSPTNVAFIPGTSTLVAANLGERFLAVLEVQS